MKTQSPTTELDHLEEELVWTRLNIQHFSAQADKAYQTYATLKAIRDDFRSRFAKADKALALAQRKTLLPLGKPKTLEAIPEELLALFDDPAKYARFKALMAEEVKEDEQS